MCQVTEIMVAAVPLRSPWLCSQRGITRGCPFRSGVAGRTTTSPLLWPLDIRRVPTWHETKVCFEKPDIVCGQDDIKKSSMMGFTRKTKLGLGFQQCNIDDPSKRLNYLYSLRGIFSEYAEEWQKCCRSFNITRMYCDELFVPHKAMKWKKAPKNLWRNMTKFFLYLLNTSVGVHSLKEYTEKRLQNAFSINASIAARS